MSTTTVYLVGAGPGDSGLITVRGRELLERADVVIYDYLANQGLLGLVRDDAKRVYVGKKGFEKHITQPEINDIIVEAARELERSGGGAIVRLKGGDPYVFGRGGEEALALAGAGIPFEVVPGVTSGVAAPAFAGIPVTHRTVSSSVTFVTGHEDPTKNESAIDWTALARLVLQGGTVCFYMGMRNLSLIAESLMREGAGSDTPVAIVQWGTSARQRSLVSSLGEVADDVARAGLGAPSIILVGRVAALRDEMSWFEKRPLFGRRIVVTRSRTQASGLTARLTELGADVVEFPTIQFVAPTSYEALDQALDSLGSYQWVIFTSVNGVDAFFDRLSGDARKLASSLVAAIGPATADRLREHGIEPDAVPAEYRGEAVYDALAERAAQTGAALAGSRVLIPRAEVARETLPDMLREAGAEVDVVAAYKTVPGDAARAAELADAMAAGEIDAVTFTSSSTVRNFVAMLGDRAGELGDVDLFSIGPVTSQTIGDAGFGVYREAERYTIPGLVDALVSAYGK